MMARWSGFSVGYGTNNWLLVDSFYKTFAMYSTCVTLLVLNLINCGLWVLFVCMFGSTAYVIVPAQSAVWHHFCANYGSHSKANLFWSLFFTTVLSYGVLVSLFGSSALPVLNANGNFSASVSLSNAPDGTLFGLYVYARGAWVDCCFVLGAVSPAICVPSMLNLQERGFGVDQGIPTLVIASSSIDDITAFSVLLSITFSQGSIIITIIRAPLEVILGIIYGIIFGVILCDIPDSQQRYNSVARSVLLLGGGVVCMFGSTALNVDGAGAIRCLVIAFVANYGWSHSNHDEAESVTQVVSFLWTIPFEPLLFGLIGTELDLANAVDWSSILHTLCVLGVALACRSLAALLAVFGASFNIKERLFISMAWLPKATVQAALGPVVYDTAVSKYGSDEQISAGLQILTTAVISILLTAPLGAALIYITGSYLLRKTTDKEDIREMDVIAKNEAV